MSKGEFVDDELAGILSRARSMFRNRDAIGAAEELEAVHSIVSRRGAQAADPDRLTALLAECVAEALSLEKHLREEVGRVNAAATARRAYGT